MPRKPSTNTTNTRKAADTIHVERDEKETFSYRLKSFVQDPRTHYVVGAVLVALAFFLAVAYISFFFTGFHDDSLLSSSDTTLKRTEIQNILGLPGAWSAERLINGSFGISSVALILDSNCSISPKLAVRAGSSIPSSGSCGHPSYWDTRRRCSDSTTGLFSSEAVTDTCFLPGCIRMSIPSV